MGALVTKALRPIKSFNIENRAHRVISKEKPVPAPKYAKNLEDMQRALESDPKLIEKLDTKDSGLDGRLKNVYVTSEGRPEDDVTKEIRRKGARPLPQSRELLEDYEFGFKEPVKMSYGRTTLRHVMNFLSAHQANPQDATISKIALEYKLKEEDVENIVTYFKTFEVYVPETPKTAARFAGPAHFRELANKQKIELESRNNEEDKTKIR